MFPCRESPQTEKLRNTLPPLSYDRYFARLRREFLRGLRFLHSNYGESRTAPTAQSLQSVQKRDGSRFLPQARFCRRRNLRVPCRFPVAPHRTESAALALGHLFQST